MQKVKGEPNATIFVKDAINNGIISGTGIKELQERKKGTKFSPVYKIKVPAHSTKTVYCRLSNKEISLPFKKGFEKVFVSRKKEADEFYDAVLPKNMDRDMAKIQRQAIAGLLWSKQYYYYDVEKWITGSDRISNVN